MLSQPKSPFPGGSKVAAYLRDSGGEEQDLSVGQQERALRDWCANNHLELTRIFRDEAKPGSSIVGRSAFQEMIHYFHGKNIPEAGLVIWSFARFSRSIDDAQYYLAGLRRRDCIIHSMTDTIPDGTVGKLIEAVYIWKNQDFLETLSKEVKRGQHDLVKDCGALGGRPPRGFVREKIELGKRRDGSPHIVHRWVPDPALIDSVRLAFEMKASGATVRQIHKFTHLYGSTASYDTFFLNRLYIGELVFGDMIIPEYVEPLVDQVTWNAVQERIQASRLRSKVHDPLNHPRRITSRWLLSGLIYCGFCDTPMNSSSVTTRSGKIFDYYTCSRKQHGMECAGRKIQKETVEKTIIDYLKVYISSPEIWEAMRVLSRMAREDYFGGIKEQILQVNQRLGNVRVRKANILNAIEKARGSETLVNRLVSLEAEERDLQRQAKSLDRRNVSLQDAFDTDLMDRLTRLLSTVEEMPAAEIKPLLSGFISKISVTRVDQTIQGNVLFYEVPRFNLLNDEFL